MKFRTFILKCSALFLILILLQKSGAGLLIHNQFHTTQSNPASSKQDQQVNQSASACDCINDFLMPFAETEELIISPLVSENIVQNTSYQHQIPFYTVVFSALRGPPVI